MIVYRKKQNNSFIGGQSPSGKLIFEKENEADLGFCNLLWKTNFFFIWAIKSENLKLEEEASINDKEKHGT